MNETTTDRLTTVLQQTGADDLQSFLQQQEQALISEEKPFAFYMRSLFAKKKLRQQDIFLDADISEKYGYKIISEEKHTRQRDTILRLCFAAGFQIKETQRALRFPLIRQYVRISTWSDKQG